MSFVKALIAAYGVRDANAKGAMPSINSGTITLSDRQLTNAEVSMTDEEEEFLKLHLKILRMSGTDNAKAKFTIYMHVFGLLPPPLKFLLIAIAAAICLLMMPTAIWMLLNVMGSRIAIAKLALISAFAFMLFILLLFID